MTAWGPGVFDDPLAVAVRAAFERAVAAGAPVPEATQATLALFGDSLDDPAASDVIYLALACLQSDLGMLQGGVRKRALAAILGNGAMSDWRNRPAEAQAARAAALEDLRWRLE